MRLKITTPEPNVFQTGSRARVCLDGVDVSKYVSRVVLTVDAQEAICAEVTFFLTGVEADVSALINPLAVEEVVT